MKGLMVWKRFKREYQGIFLVAIFIISFYVLSAPLESGVVMSLAPDEVVNQYFTHLYATQGDLKYSPPFNDIAGEMFRPRGTVPTVDGQVAPGKFLGFPIFAGSLERMFGTEFTPYVTAFFGSLGICFLFLLIRQEFNQWVAMLGAPLALYTTYYYWGTQYFYEDVFALFFVICGLYYVLKGLKLEDRVSFASGCLLLGCSVVFKPYYFAVFIPLILITFRNLDIRSSVIPFLFSFIGPIMMLVANTVVYGDPLTTGFHVLHGVDDTIVPFTQESHIEALIQNSFDYLSFLYPLSFIGLFGLVTQTINKILKKQQIWLEIFFISISSLLIFYVLGLSGATNVNNAHNSAVRYLLFFNILLLPYALVPFAIILDKFKNKKASVLKAAIAIGIAILIIMPGMALYPLVDGNTYNRVRYNSYTDYLEVKTSESSILICQYTDKYYFPARITGNPLFLDSDNMESDTANISIELTNRGYDVYLVTDVAPAATRFNYSYYESCLISNGYKLTPIYGMLLIQVNATAVV